MKERKAKSIFASKAITMKDLGEFTEQVILPGVENLIEPIRKDLGDLKEEMRSGFAEMRKGFSDISKSFRVLGGDIAELKENEKEHKHDAPPPLCWTQTLRALVG